MHFYCFSTFFATTNITNYANHSCCSCYLLFLFLVNGFHGFHVFFCVFCVICCFFVSPIQELEPGATPCRGGRCVPLSSRTAAAGNKNTLIMIMQVPADGVEPPQRPCRARDGVGLLFINFNSLYCIAVYITVASLP